MYLYTNSITISIILCLCQLDSAAGFAKLPPSQHQQKSTSFYSKTTHLHVSSDSEDEQKQQQSRRDIFRSFIITSSAVLSSSTTTPSIVNAFDNKISNKYDDRPKRRGPQPKDLGVRTRKDMIGDEYVGLKPCGPAPNCFCSTDAIEDDPEHNIPSWKFPTKTMEKESAFQMLENTINGYKPGQGNIDGGGFQIVTSDTKKGYIYVQFESLKNGYIDDLEFAYIDGFGGDENNAIQVRSSSRVGYLDFSVNAKRLNYIAKELRSQGWDVPGVDPATHRDYFAQNQQ